MLGIGSILTKANVVRSLVRNALILYWKGDEAEPTSSGNFIPSIKNHAVNTNTTSVNFIDNTDYLNTNETFQSIFRNSFTFSFWVKPDDGQPSGSQFFWGANDGTNNNRIRAELRNNGDFRFTFTADGETGEFQTSSEVFTDGPQDSFTHIVISVTKPTSGDITVVLYINGVVNSNDTTLDTSLNQSSVSSYTSTGNFVIGIRENNPSLGHRYTGKIDEFGIFSTDVDQEIVNEIYNNGIPKNLNTITENNASDSLIAYYKMGDGTSDDAQILPYTRAYVDGAESILGGVICNQINTGLGNNLIANGDFSNGVIGAINDIPNWIKSKSSASSHSSVQLQINNSGQLVINSGTGNIVGGGNNNANDYGIAVQKLPSATVPGKVYKVIIDIISVTGGEGIDRFRLGTNDDDTVGSLFTANITVDDSSLTTGLNKVFYFKATAAHQYIAVGGRNDVTQVVVDNIRLFEFNSNPAIAFNNLTFSTDTPSNNSGLLNKSGVALDFNGTSDFVDLEDLTTGEAANEKTLSGPNLTYAFWLKLDVNNVTQNIIDTQEVDGGDRIRLQVSNSGAFELKAHLAGVGVTGKTFSSINTGVYNRFVVTIEGANVSVYINGSKDGNTKSFDSPFNFSADSVVKLTIGAQGVGTHSSFLNGKMCDVQIYDALWTQDDVTFDYNNFNSDVFENPLSNIKYTDCKYLFRLTEGLNSDVELDRVFNSAAVLSEDLISSPNDMGVLIHPSFFSSNMILNSDNSVTMNHVDTSFFKLISYENGELYQFTISGSGKARIRFGSSGNAANYVDGNGGDSGSDLPFTIIKQADSDFERIQVRVPFPGSEVTVTGVSVKELKPSRSFLKAGDKLTFVKQDAIRPLALSSYSKKLVFDGANDYLQLPNTLAFNPSTAFTISFFFIGSLSSNTNSQKYILSENGDGSYVSLDFNTGSADQLKYKFEGENEVAINLISTYNLQESGVLHHVVLSVPAHGSSVTVYIDGVAQTATDLRPNATFKIKLIGRGGTSSLSYFDSFLDEISIFQKTFSLQEVVELYNGGRPKNARAHSASSSLTAYWRNNGRDMNSNATGGDIWDDLSGFGNNLTLHGTTSTRKEIILEEVPFLKRDSLGLFMNKSRQKGLNFNGSGYVSLPSSDFSSIAPTSISVDFWFKPMNSSALKGLVAKYIDANNSSWFITEFSGSIGWFVNSGGSGLTSSATLNRNQWYHICCTYDGTISSGNVRKIYINGVKDTEDTQNTSIDGPIRSSTADIEVGTYGGDNDDRKFMNIIDDVKIYSRVLSDSEILKNFNVTKSKHLDNIKWSDETTFFPKKSYNFTASSVGGYIDTNQTFQNTFRNSFSFGFWVKPNDGQPASTQHVFGSQSSNGQNLLELSLDTDGDFTLLFKCNNDEARFTTSGSVFLDGASGSTLGTTWVHLLFAIKYNGAGNNTTAVIYVNGSPYNQVSSLPVASGDNHALFTTSSNLVIGARRNSDGTINDGSKFNGSIDDFAIFSKEILASEASSIYNNGNIRDLTQNFNNYVSSSSIVYYNKMGDSPGDRAPIGVVCQYDVPLNIT